MIKYDVLLYDATHDYDQLYTYHHGTPLNIGERVLVPFGSKNLPREAVVVRENQSDQMTKAVVERLDIPSLPEKLIELFFDIHHYYLCPMGQLLRLALPMPLRVKPDLIYLDAQNQVKLDANHYTERELSNEIEQGHVVKHYVFRPMRKPKKQHFLIHHGDPSQLEAFRNQLPKRLRKVRSVLAVLMEQGEYLLDKRLDEKHLDLLLSSPNLLLEERVIATGNTQPNTLILPLPALTEPQKELAGALLKPAAHLLQGPPGSGKSLLLMHLVKRVLQQNKRFIWLVSDSLQAMATHQDLYRYFGEDIALMHAHQNKSEILFYHEQIVNNQCAGVVGSRNALFAPLQDVGIIVIDDCADDRFVSELPDFDFRKAAQFYAARQHIPVVMASSVPDLFQLGDKTIEKHYLDSEAVPVDRHWHLIDMRKAFLKESMLLSPQVLEALDQRSLLYLNRLGYAGAVLCEHCLYVELCTQCHSTLFYSQSKQRLNCRQCGATQPFHELCPRCYHSMHLKGSGTETLEEGLKLHFPMKKVQRFDSLSLSRKSDLMQASSTLKRADIVIATARLSPGLTIDGLKCVVHVAPDANLFLPEYRSAERTFRELILTGAMAGRHEEGHVYIQTEMPENYVYKYAIAQEILPFLKYEYKLRKHHALPPFMHLIRIMLQHQRSETCLEFASRLKEALSVRFDYTCRGPYRPVYEKKGKYYEQNLLFSDLTEMQDLKDYLSELMPRGSQRMRIVVDPLTIMY